MDYEREIPFGVFDSELMHQEISIPDGFTATIEGDKIILTRIESEDEKIRKWIKKELENKYVECGIVNNVLADKAFAWLEKQKHLYEKTKDRFYCEGFEEGQLYEKQKEQKHVEWSEEDEKMLNQIISIIENADDNLVRPENISIYTNWLKSKVQPQLKWKPSELQIEALESATANCAYSEYEDCLKELIKQLKQL